MLSDTASLHHAHPALRNVGGCFSDYFMFEVLCGRRYEGLVDAGGAADAREKLAKTWREAERRLGPRSSLQETEYHWYRPLIEALGLRIEAAPPVLFGEGGPPRTGLCVASRGRTLALAEFHPFGLDPDRDASPGSAGPAGASMERALEASPCRWGYLFAGPLARLYRAGAGVASSYLEADFRALRDNDDPAEWEVFWNLFRFEALAAGFLDRVGEESHLFAARIGDDLRASARCALEALAQGLLDEPGNRGATGAGPGELFEQALLVLYRVLFVLYAESRGLLPLSNDLYRESYSMHRLRDLAERQGPGGRGTFLWESLRSLFRLVGGGMRSPDLSLQACNGRLFAPERTALFESATIRDGAVREAILALSLAPGGADGRPAERVSYEQLGVAQLGSIYEGLLALSPRIAPAEDDGTDRSGAGRGSKGGKGGRGKGGSAGRTPPFSPSPSLPFERRAPPGGGGASGRRFALEGGSGARKSAGAYYTPEAFTAFLTRRALAPLVEGRSSAEILDLRVLDPAMGSGAFLIQASRFLGEAYGRALAREGAGPARADAETFALHKRTVAEHCLYGVDLLPLAVELAKVSLWLETAACGKPLTFLDHRLRAGNSLVGAELAPGPSGFAPVDLVPDSVLPPPLRGRNRRERADLMAGQLSLFGEAGVAPLLVKIAGERRALDAPEETAEDVKRKETRFRRIMREGSSLDRLKKVGDLWCALWFRGGGRAPPTTFAFREICDALRRGREADPGEERIAGEAAGREKFFHWELEFPEVFSRERRGFDAVLGNPPWEVYKPGPGDAEDPEGQGAPAEDPRRLADLSRFVRESGNYRRQGGGDLNSYKLFLERIVGLLAEGGRFGVMVPSGFATDQGSAELREEFFRNCRVEGFYGFENRERIFPIHSSYKFGLLFGGRGGSTKSLDAAFMLRSPSSLPAAAKKPLRMPLSFVKKFSGGDLSLPECRSREELDVLARICSAGEPLDSRAAPPFFEILTEFHIRNDKELIRPLPLEGGEREGRARLLSSPRTRAREDTRPPGAGALVPLLQGRCIHQFRPDFAPPGLGVPADAARERTSRVRAAFKIAHRRIARDTDERTLIAAIVPSGRPCEMNATVIAVEPPPGEPAEPHLLFALGILNSFVVDFAIRKKVSTTLNMFFLKPLPLPRLPRGNPAFEAIAAGVARLSCTSPEYAALWDSAWSEAWPRLGEGFEGLPRRWTRECGLADFGSDGRRDGEGRARLRAGIDALAARRFGLARGEFAFLIDTFDVLRRNEEKAFGEFRSRRLALEAFDAAAGGA